MTWRSRTTQRHPDEAAGIDRPSRYEFSKVSVEFESGDGRCHGWLYRPDRPSNPRAIVMANGFGTEKSFGLPRYAERFAASGYAVLLFDYRHFGDSTGEPRNLVSPGKQLTDWQAAVSSVRNAEGVDGRRPVLWGWSMGGGTALRVAAEDHRIAAVVALQPFVDGRAKLRSRGLKFALKGLAAGVRDRLQSPLFGPYTVPIVGDAEEFAFVTEGGAKYDFLDLVPEDSSWENEAPARTMLSIPRFRPLTVAEDVSCPVFVVAGDRDEVVPPETVVDAAAAMPNATLLRLPIGHFDGLRGDGFERVVRHQLAFLDTTL